MFEEAIAEAEQALGVLRSWGGESAERDHGAGDVGLWPEAVWREFGEEFDGCDALREDADRAVVLGVVLCGEAIGDFFLDCHEQAFAGWPLREQDHDERGGAGVRQVCDEAEACG